MCSVRGPLPVHCALRFQKASICQRLPASARLATASQVGPTRQLAARRAEAAYGSVSQNSFYGEEMLAAAAWRDLFGLKPEDLTTLGTVSQEQSR